MQSTVAIHAFDRTDKGLVGLVLQATNSNPHNDYYVSRDTRFYTGVEAQRYLDKVTLSGRAAYFFGIGSNQQDQNTQNSTGYNLALSAKYFRTANTSFALEGGFEGAISNLDGYRSVHHAWLVGGKAEHRLSAYPVSLTTEVTYRQGKYEGDSYRDHDLRALVGFKVNFGSKTLLERDRNGASLETVKSLAASDNGYNDY